LLTVDNSTVYLANDLDRSVEEIVWSLDSQTIYSRSKTRRKSALRDPAPGGRKGNGDIGVSPLRRSLHWETRDFIVASSDSLTNAAKLFASAFARDDTSYKRLTGVNDKIFASRALPSV